MSTSIIEVRAATNQEWDDLWRESANSTYFHSREWAEIWSSYTNGRIQPPPRPLIDLAVILNNVLAVVFDRGPLRDERFTWMYLVVAKKPDVS